MQVSLYRIIFSDGIFFCNAHPVLYILQHPYMSPETEYLIADHFLEPVHKAHGHDHNGHADGRGNDGQAYDEFGKGLLPVKGYSS